MKNWHVGIDPGIGGALCVLDEQGGLVEVVDLPVVEVHVNRTKRFRLSPGLLSLKIQTLGPRTLHAFVEEVGGDPKMGGGAAFNFGLGFGLILQALTDFNIPHTLVRPQAWQKAHGLSRGGLSKDERKGNSRARAMALWPAASGYFARVRDDGRAEAALIAWYGRATLGCA